MKPPDILGLFIRCVGVPLSLYGVYSLYNLVLALIPGFPAAHSVASFLYRGLPSLVIGVWFLSGAKWLISFCYPSEHQDKTHE